MPNVVRAEDRHTGRPTRPRDRRPEPVGADVREERRGGVPILARRQVRLDRVGERGMELDPQWLARLRRSRAGRTLSEEGRDYPAQGPFRPAGRKRWFVVGDANGVEITRTLSREAAELYL